MGRSSYSNRLFAGGLKKLEISWFKSNGYLTLGKLGGTFRGEVTWADRQTGDKSSIRFYISTMPGNMKLDLSYGQTDEYGSKTLHNYKVNLTTTKCNYGGRRFWFICPLVSNNKKCGKRVSKLYLAGAYFGCRHCHDLTYVSRMSNRRSRGYYLTRRWQLEDKLGLLLMKTNRATYAGKPTKKELKIMFLEKILNC